LEKRLTWIIALPPIILQHRKRPQAGQVDHLLTNYAIMPQNTAAPLCSVQICV